MRVEWLNCRLTFQPETEAEETALSAVWVAFGSQIDDRPGFDDPDDYELDSANFINLPATPESVGTDH